MGGRGARFLVVELNEFERAEKDLREALGDATALKRDYLALDCRSRLCLVSAAVGDFSTTVERCEEAINWASARGLTDQPVMIPVFLMRAWAAWDDPFFDDDALVDIPDALIVTQDGVITAFGPYEQTKASVPDGVEVTHYPNHLICAGFVDTHVHYVQTGIIGAFGSQLIDWLNHYTFIEEQNFADQAHAADVAKRFFDELLRNGTTTAVTFCAVYPGSVDAFFEESERRGTRMIGGKVLMDRNAPDHLLDTAKTGYDDSKALIDRWHGKGRNLYAITPRFAPTSTPEQLEAAGALWKEHPGTYQHTHVSENVGEIQWVRSLFPERAGYLDVYDHYGLLGPRAVLAHGVHLTARERARVSRDRERRSRTARPRTCSSAAACSTSTTPKTPHGPCTSGSAPTSGPVPASRSWPR